MPALPWPLVAASLLIVFAAGIVRGFAGFGFSALCVAGLSLFVPPAQVVPPIFVLEVLASLTLLRGALKDADWSWLSWLALGNALFIPLGVALLAFVPETPLRLLIGALLLVAAALLRTGFTLALAPTRTVRLATGLVSGFVNGVAAIGGIAVAVLLSAPRTPPRGARLPRGSWKVAEPHLHESAPRPTTYIVRPPRGMRKVAKPHLLKSAPRPTTYVVRPPRGMRKVAKPHLLKSTAQLTPAAMRATMIVLFLFTDLYALAWAGIVSAGGASGNDLLGRDTLSWALWLAPAMLAGIWFGQRSFAGVSADQFRRHVLNLLILIAGVSVVRALLSLTVWGTGA